MAVARMRSEDSRQQHETQRCQTVAIKVLIERTVKAGREGLVWDMLRDLRGEAVRQRGYLYGETWRSLDNPRVFMVSSTWGHADYWENWVRDDFRMKMEAKIQPYLRKAGRIRIFEEISTLRDDAPASRNGTQ
jgi:heme-degrading monooxygenase HmoA